MSEAAIGKKIQADIITAMKAKDEHRLTTLRMVKSALKNKEIDKREQLRKLGRAYLRGFDEHLRDSVRTRFDVVSVYLLATGVECERLEDAFAWHEPNRTRPYGV